MSTYPLPPEEQPQPPAAQPDEHPSDDDWQPYRPTPQPAPVFPRPGPLEQQPGNSGGPPPGHHIPQRDDRRPAGGHPYSAPPPPMPQQPPQEGPPPFPGPLAPGPGQGHHIPYGAPPPPPAFAPPVGGPQPPPPAYAPPVSGPQPPPPAPGHFPPQVQPYVQPQFRPPYEPRPEQPQPMAADTAVDLPPARPGLRRRRLIELGVLLILAPAVVGVRWYDDSNHAVTQDPHQRVTVVARGAWAKLGHNQWRMLGRQDRPATDSEDMPAGGATLVLLLQAKVLDAQGVKELGKMDYVIRDRAGRIWSAEGAVENQSIDEEKPTPGSTQRVKVIATVPRSKLSEVVLDLHIRPFDRAERTVLDVLRFAH